MNDTSTNPIFVALLFILRCAVPLVILFGISYLLRKMGLVAVETPEPPDDREEEVVEELASVAEESPVPPEDVMNLPKDTAGESLNPSAKNPTETPTVESPKES